MYIKPYFGLWHFTLVEIDLNERLVIGVSHEVIKKTRTKIAIYMENHERIAIHVLWNDNKKQDTDVAYRHVLCMKSRCRRLDTFDSRG